MDRRKPAAQPDFADVVAFLGGDDLQPERAERLRRVLRDDPELARAGLDAVDPEGLAAVAEVSSAEIDQAWARFQAGLAAPATASAEKKGEVVALEPPPERVVSFRLAVWALAATLLLGVGLGVLVASRGAAPPSGKVFVASLTLANGDPLRGGEPEPLRPDRDATLVLLLHPPSRLEGDLPPRVRGLLSRPGTGEALSVEATLAPTGPYAVGLDPTALAPGEYRLALVRPGESSPFAAYVFVLAGPRP